MRKSLTSLLLVIMIGSLLTIAPSAAGASVPDKPFTSTQCEGYSDSVARLYSTGLGRSPEQGGFDFWTTEYTLGNWSFPAMAQFFVDSAEFQESYGDLTQDQFIRQLYRNVLGREGEAGGVEFWNQQMTAGMNRATVLMRFAESPENIQLTGTVEPTLGLFNEGRQGRWRCGPSLLDSMFQLSDFPSDSGWIQGFNLTEGQPGPDCDSSLYVPLGSDAVQFFTDAFDGTSVTQSTYIAPTPYGAKRYLAQVRQAVANCSSFVNRDRFVVEMSEMSFTSFGDDSVAIRSAYSTPEDGYLFDRHLVVIQDGLVVTAVWNYPAGTADPAETEVWAALAAERLAALPFT